ncbi:methyl-accepting chemotaxis protein [Asticcacaulis biprosthecium]|uniref:methyl-accepting chemotaxis protein n=1 Tax=Asticcacaulis biprosthecium TaxID=76891 RepID=UPI0002F5C248|nr:methyl-accepting chemotaxis protein [Asticcacaulis biprosthecium]
MLSLNNIKLRGKLALIVGTLSVPLVIMSGLFINTNLQDIGFAEKEKVGTAYLRPVWQSLSSLYAAVEDGQAPQAHLKGVDLAESAALAQKLGIEPVYQDTRKALDAIGFPARPIESAQAASGAVTALSNLVTETGNLSNLTLDPDLDTYYLQNIITVNLPSVGGQNNDVYQTILAQVDQPTTLKFAVELGSELGSLGEARDATSTSVQSALKGTKDQALAGRINPALATFTAASDAYANQGKALLERVEAGGRVTRADIEALLPLHEALEASADTLWTTSADELDRLLQARIDGLWLNMLTLLGIAGAIAAAALGLAVYIALEISGTLGRMSNVMTRLASDDFDVTVVGAQRRDEIGAMAKSVEIFKQNGMSSKRVAAENLRIKVALDNCSTNVMMADPEGKIIYLNTSVRAMMTNAESDMRAALPNFDASKLDGANIDVFHKNPAHQRGMLERLTATFKTQIKVGTRQFDLIASPVIDDAGQRLGSVVEWKDITAEKHIESEVDRVVQAAVAGDFSERLELEGKTGFMRNLAEAMNRLCENTAESLNEVSIHLGYLAEGDLTRRIEHSYSGLFEDLKNKLNETSDKLCVIVEQVTAGAGEIKVATAEITAGTNDLSQRTEQQASSLQETASSMEEIASTIKQNADNAQQASKLAGTASSVAGKGGEVVSQAVQAMSRIEASSQKISDIIGVIDEIAFQTNLLALNAAVEAARAGDAGKGFAVVAAEVRSLAQRSSGAAKDIKTLIAASGSEVKDGVKLVNDAGGALSEIVGSIRQVAEIISEIAAASKEQSVGVEEINTAVSQMDEMTQQNSALVEQNAASSRMLQDQAENMHSRMAYFSLPRSANLREAVRPVEVARTSAPASRKAPVRRVAGGAARLQDDLRSAMDADWAEF